MSAVRVDGGSIDHHIIRPLDAVSFGGAPCSAAMIPVRLGRRQTLSRAANSRKCPTYTVLNKL